MTNITVAPDVQRITEGLRDTGYDVNTAVADLVDNAIAARATLIDVRIALKDDGEPVVAIGDNGHGMDRDGLINSMRYGSRPDEDESRLGKFGMGLKTASTAFCRRLVVASRASVQDEALQAVWDLDHLAASGAWELELGEPEPDILEYLDLCTGKGPGTVVVWQKIDRLLSAEAEPLEQDLPPGERESVRQRLDRIVAALSAHLSLVFQRYLDPAFEQTRTVHLFVNDTMLTPRDPFLQEFSSAAGTHILTVTQGDEVVPLVITAHLLPRAETLPDEAAREAAELTASRQGIYVYRENRLIHGPDWLGIQAQDPVWTLLRVSLSFDSRIDDVFMVDIKKSRVLINEHLYAWLKNAFLPPLLERAAERWRQGAAENTRLTATARHTVSDAMIERHLGSLRQAEVLEVFADKNDVLVRNNAGTTRASVEIVSAPDAELTHFHAKASIREDALWAPALVNGNPAVSLNVGHPFYTKVYLPNEQNATLIQALDMLFWALAQAEVNNVTEESRTAFASLRAELARNVAKLIQDLPDA